jgi:hypothetical protein
LLRVKAIVSEHRDPHPPETPGWRLLSESWIFAGPKSANLETRQLSESIHSLGLENAQEAQIQEAIMTAVKSARTIGKPDLENLPILIQIWTTGLDRISYSDNASDTHPGIQQTQNRAGIYLIEKTLVDMEIRYQGTCRVIDVRIYGQ